MQNLMKLLHGFATQLMFTLTTCMFMTSNILNVICCILKLFITINDTKIEQKKKIIIIKRERREEENLVNSKNYKPLKDIVGTSNEQIDQAIDKIILRHL